MSKIIGSKRKELKSEISNGSSILYEPDLPFPYVHYASYYGIFFGYAKAEKGEVYLCSCSKSIIHNYLNENRGYRLHKMHLANDLIPYVDKRNFLFAEKICHRCNLLQPKLRYCHEMYGGMFKQYFGWFINQTKLRFNYRSYDDLLNDNIPEDLKKIGLPILEIYQRQNDIIKICDEQGDYKIDFGGVKFYNFNKAWYELGKEADKISRKIENYFENITREEFGLKKIGESNISEMLMANIIRKLFPSEEMLLHHRPQWLNKLELDVYIPSLKLAFEYQGQQHFFPIKAWGGEKAFNKLVERDAIKKEICHLLGITLIEINYFEPLDYDFIKDKTNLILSKIKS